MIMLTYSIIFYMSYDTFLSLVKSSFCCLSKVNYWHKAIIWSFTGLASSFFLLFANCFIMPFLKWQQSIFFWWYWISMTNTNGTSISWLCESDKEKCGMTVTLNLVDKTHLFNAHTFSRLDLFIFFYFSWHFSIEFSLVCKTYFFNFPTFYNFRLQLKQHMQYITMLGRIKIKDIVFQAHTYY